MDDHRIPEGSRRSVPEPPTYCLRAGVLRYSGEFNSANLTTILPASQPLTEYPVTCEYCEERAKPSVNLSGIQQSETFCCVQQQQLWEMLERDRCLAGGPRDPRTTSLGDQWAPEKEELLFQGWEMEDPKSVKHPVAETSELTSKVLRFRLSCAPENGCCIVYPRSADEEHLKMKEEEEEVLLPTCDHKPLQFGICHHQDGADILQKNYSSGVKFLTVFPDGSAQVFYPSGLLALIVVVPKENRRVCIVYDDSSAPHQPLRALFLSDGRGTCYHSNGNIWLTLDGSGGQCLDEGGARVRRWCWGRLSSTPIPLRPIFLSLNKAIGVRVLGREKVFVSFLAGGQQAKFSVGACCTQGECKTDRAASGPSVSKWDLLESAARIRAHLAIQRLHQFLSMPSHPRPPKTKEALRLHAEAHRLLAASADVMMSDSDRAFVHRCLQDYI
nr:glutamate-rich protein 6 isoform X2 [Scatophagus argus]XP_046264065.1 glutamate-rich protein 6 isoform X2 [Scatophagus argus]